MSDIRYGFSVNIMDETRREIERRANELGNEAFKLALAEQGYVKVEEAKDIELLRWQRVFERETRIEELEQLCRDLWDCGVSQRMTFASRLRLRERMARLGLVEQSERVDSAEQLCRDMHEHFKYSIDMHEQGFDRRMEELGLIEGGE